MGNHFSSRLTATLNLCLIYIKIIWPLVILLEHKHKKFEIIQTKIKGGCQSGRKVVTHNSKSDSPLMFGRWVGSTVFLTIELDSITSASFSICEQWRPLLHQPTNISWNMWGKEKIWWTSFLVVSSTHISIKRCERVRPFFDIARLATVPCRRSQKSHVYTVFISNLIDQGGSHLMCPPCPGTGSFWTR